MRLIPAKETVNFLSQAAPRPWVQRMLSWMVLNEELDAWSRGGSVQAHSTVQFETIKFRGVTGETHGPKMDAAIRDHYWPELAEQLMGKLSDERVYDEPVEWSEIDDPRHVDPGFFLWSSEVDWEMGTLKVDWLPDTVLKSDPLFPSEDLFSTGFDHPGFTAEFRGLSFHFSAIDMLLPNHQLRAADAVEADVEPKRSAGRPRTWDWERAMAFIVSQAQHPDGLPVGPGAQARIEEMMAEWFLTETGNSPAPSQVRQRAAVIIKMLEKPITPKID